MAERVTINRWSIEPYTGWIGIIHKDRSDPESTEFLELASPSKDATLRLTPDDRSFDAAEWVEIVAKNNRDKKRPVISARHGDLTGCMVEFAASDEWIRGWALMAGPYPLDVCYRCKKKLEGRDDRAVKLMLDTLRLESCNPHSTTVADVEGPWINPNFESGLIERCKAGWNSPVVDLSNELLATYLRQKVALSLVVPEASKRLATNFVDDTEQYDNELKNALAYAMGEG